MTDPRRPSQRGPGSPWLWLTAWSVQGGAILSSDALGLEPGIAKFLVTGLLAAVPLVALYLLLLRRPSGESESRSNGSDGS